MPAIKILPVQPIVSADLPKLIVSEKASLTIVNLWATFCGPCVEEFPEFVKFYRDHQKNNLKLIFISADFKSDLPLVEKFLTEQGVEFQTFIKNEKDDAFINGVHKKWNGALPATLFYNSKGALVHFAFQPLNYSEIEKISKPYLKEETAL